MSTRMMIVSITLAVVVLGVLGRRSSSGQQQFPQSNRKPACGCYACGKLLAVDFPNKAKDCVGILANDACPEALSALPDRGKAYCQLVKTKSKNGSLNECQELAQYCDSLESPPPPASKCEKPAPWFDVSDSSKCRDVQYTQLVIDEKTATATVSMCGSKVFSYRSQEFVGKDDLFRSAYISSFISRIPKTVCCDKFHDAVRTGVPCDPRADVDCDGQPNQADTYGGAEYPDFSDFTTSPGESVDVFEFGLPEPPPSRLCDCKWELVKGVVQCSQDGRRPHAYQASWKCSSTGNEKFTRVEADAKSLCISRP